MQTNAFNIGSKSAHHLSLASVNTCRVKDHPKTRGHANAPARGLYAKKRMPKFRRHGSSSVSTCRVIALYMPFKESTIKTCFKL